MKYDKELFAKHLQGMVQIPTVSSADPEQIRVEEFRKLHDYLEEAYNMLEILGLDLITNSEEDVAEHDIEDTLSNADARALVPNGIYKLARKIKRLDNRVFHGTMEVENGVFILKAGSEVTPDEGTGLAPNIQAFMFQCC